MVSIWGVFIFIAGLLAHASGNVVINEVASRGGGGVCSGEDWVELFNNGTAEANISKYHLCDDKGCADKKAFTFAKNSTIPGMGYLYLCRDKKTSDGFKFGIGGDDTVTLNDPTGKLVFTTGALKGRSDSATYAMLHSGSFDYVATPTPGKANDQTLAPVICLKGQACWGLFDESKLRSYNIEIIQSDIDKMGAVRWPDPKKKQTPYTLRDATDEVYVPCIVTINYGSGDAERLPYAGCRFKGSKGAWLGCDKVGLLTGQHDHCRKLSLKFDANYFNKTSGASFHGLKKLQMHSMHADNSLMRERLAYGLMQRVGFLSPRAVHASLFINGKLDGVRLLVEQIDDEFLDAAGRYPDKIAKASTLYKELWVTGCTDKPEVIKCSTNADCQACNSCIGDCLWRQCGTGMAAGMCLNGKPDARCVGKADGHLLKDTGTCFTAPGIGEQRVSMCTNSSAPPDCVLKQRKEGSGDHRGLFKHFNAKATACMNNATACTKAMASKILSEFMNTTSVVDALVATLLDMDQFTTMYNDAGHNFYTLVSNHTGKDIITMIPWDFDRGLAACVSTKCEGGGQLGDLMFTEKAPMMKGGLKGQDAVPWGRCQLPPWFANMKARQDLNQRYCIDRVMTFASHMHASCEPAVHLMGLALKREYAARMTQFLDGASEWGQQRITQWRSQIRPLVEGAAKQGGFPTVEAWDATLDGLKVRLTEVLTMGTSLAASAKAAAEAETTPPSASAAQCLLEPNEVIKCADGSSNACLEKHCGATADKDVCVEGGKADADCCATANGGCKAGYVHKLANSKVCYRDGMNKAHTTCCFKVTSTVTTTTSTASTAAPSVAQTQTKFTGSIIMSAEGLNASVMATAAKAAIATHFDVDPGTVVVTVSKSRRLSAAPRKLAETWVVAYEFSAPAAKVAGVETKVAALSTAAAKVALKSVFGEKLISAGASQSSVDSVTVTTAVGTKVIDGNQTSGATNGAGAYMTILSVFSVTATLLGMSV